MSRRVLDFWSESREVLIREGVLRGPACPGAHAAARMTFAHADFGYDTSPPSTGDRAQLTGHGGGEDSIQMVLCTKQRRLGLIGIVSQARTSR